MKCRRETIATIGVGMLLVIVVVFIFATSAQKAEVEGAAAGTAENSAGAEDEDDLMDPPGEDSGIVSGISDADLSGEATGNVNADSPTENTGISSIDPAAGNAGIFSTGHSLNTLTVTLEGMEERVPADLYVGAGYGILILSEGWNMYRAGAWMADVNDEVQLIIQDYGEKTKEQVVEYLLSIGYSVTEEDTAKLRRNHSELTTTIELIEQTDSEEAKTWGILYRYPPEAEEGFKARLAVMADSFRIMPKSGMAAGAASEPEPWQSMPASVYEKAYGMPDMREFWEAYLTGERDVLKEYLSEDFEGDPDVFPNGTDGHNAEKAELLAVRWEKIEGRAIGDISICSLEIMPGEEDSPEYLTIALILEEDYWKVSWYGLEK